MIPKIIHYCWFGKNPKPKKVQFCLESWEKLGYSIKEWNEENSIFNNKFAQKNYKEKKWAFVSDYVRLVALYKEGGIYLDTDVLITNKIPKNILETDFLIGYQWDCLLGTHFIGSQKESPIIKDILDSYDDYKEENIPNNHVFNDYFLLEKEFKLNGENQEIIVKNQRVNIYSKEYFSIPKFYRPNYAFHLLDNSWKNKNQLKMIIQKMLKIIFGKVIYYNLLAKKAYKISPYRNKGRKI